MGAVLRVGFALTVQKTACFTAVFLMPFSDRSGLPTAQTSAARITSAQKHRPQYRVIPVIYASHVPLATKFARLQATKTTNTAAAEIGMSADQTDKILEHEKQEL